MKPTTKVKRHFDISRGCEIADITTEHGLRHQLQIVHHAVDHQCTHCGTRLKVEPNKSWGIQRHDQTSPEIFNDPDAMIENVASNLELDEERMLEKASARGFSPVACSSCNRTTFKHKDDVEDPLCIACHSQQAVPA